MISGLFHNIRQIRPEQKHFKLTKKMFSSSRAMMPIHELLVQTELRNTNMITLTIYDKSIHQYARTYMYNVVKQKLTE